MRNTIDTEAKRKIKKIIGQLIDKQIDLEKEYITGYCSKMKDVLEIIRNSFSHIGRVYIGKDNNIVLNDYDNNNNKSGEVISTYENIISILKDPYNNTNKKK